MNIKYIIKEYLVCVIMYGIFCDIGCFFIKLVECFVLLFFNILGEDFSRVYLFYVCNVLNLLFFKIFVCLLNLKR